MAQAMIVTIQTSADGVSTETLSMERAVQARRQLLYEHLQSAPHQVKLSGGDHVHRTRAQTRSMEETEKVGMLKARLQFTEQNAYDLRRVAEYENTIAKEVLNEGRAFLLLCRTASSWF
eukprot:5032050-Amphidinium_carterae.6